MKKIIVYDTTLRDGNQAEDVNLSLEDKIKIARKLDELGVDYIEGGWPGASPVDTTFFQEIATFPLRHAKIAAFGATHHPQKTPETDSHLQAILEACPQAATIFGKSCFMHIKEALHITPEKYVPMVTNSVLFLSKRLPEVFFDAEHFFDGFMRDKDCSLAIIGAALEGGAKNITLCDTNGGTLPQDIKEIIEEVQRLFPGIPLGIHAHNDCELGVANSIAAVQSGVTLVQGTINGIGERCGNANLCSIIPILERKIVPQEYRCLPPNHLPLLRHVSTYIAEVANMSPFSRQPFVGRSAFAHKGGVHVSAVNKNSVLYEHLDPTSVGNEQRILLTELAGRSNIISLAKRFGFHLEKDDPVVKSLLVELKEKASLGYDYAAAEASVELLLMRKLQHKAVREFFNLIQFRVIEAKQTGNCASNSEATVTLEVEGAMEHTAAFGCGPVNALDNALRKALGEFYPSINEMRLVDFKVRVLSANKKHSGTASQVRVLIESADISSKWVTVGVSPNIIEASWQALIDSVTYKLYKDELLNGKNGSVA